MIYYIHKITTYEREVNRMGTINYETGDIITLGLNMDFEIDEEYYNELVEDMGYTEEEAREVLYRLSESVGARLRKAGQKAGMVSVEIKYYNFETCSHQKQLLKATNSDQMICNAAIDLFRELWNGEPVRLL